MISVKLEKDLACMDAELNISIPFLWILFK
jgi:hypothetical protein